MSRIKEYQAQGLPVEIADAATTRSTLSISGSGTVADLEVWLSIRHGYDADLDVYLKSPDGTRVALFCDVGGKGDDFDRTTLDDEAKTSVVDGAAPFRGWYRPAGQLADLRGKSLAGTWTLEVTDDDAQVSGTLDAWGLVVTRDAPTPPSMVKIAGQITWLDCLAGVRVTCSPGTEMVTGDGGYYEFTVPLGWSGKVTPSAIGFTFDPPFYTVTNLSTYVYLDFEAIFIH